jgi:hypothetical protein
VLERRFHAKRYCTTWTNKKVFLSRWLAERAVVRRQHAGFTNITRGAYFDESIQRFESGGDI